MDVDIKPEEDEMEISPAVILSDSFNASYSYAENWYDTTKQSLICAPLEDTKSSDREIQINSTTVGAPAVNVDGKGVVHVHTVQDNSSTPVGNLIKDKPCLYISPNDIQIGKVCTFSQSQHLVAESVSLGGQINPTAQIFSSFQIQPLNNDQVLTDYVNLPSQSIAKPFLIISPAIASDSNLTPVLQPCHMRTHRPILPAYCKPFTSTSIQEEDYDVKIKKKREENGQGTKREKIWRYVATSC